MEIHLNAAKWAVYLALPIMLIGTLFFISAMRSNDFWGGVMGGIIAAQIYILGFPLVGLFWRFISPYIKRGLAEEEDWWHLPITNILFLIQWLIWSQLIALIIRLF
ncbi:MAG TPA: hypothetical protein VF648_16220 [Pyrinomonadaceae bacterium]|jgi:hypothetical protein